MAKLTYANKVALNENPEIADINKVKDTDMNEIKSVVNGLDDNIGTLSNLTTTAKTSAVAAINELNSNKASTNEVLIQDTEPTAADNKIWIDTGEISQQASEITNSYSTSTGIGYSANYSNEHFSGVELYNNASGTNGTVALSDNVDNYNYIEIYYSNAGKTKSSSTKLMKGFYSTTLKVINISKTTTAQNTQEYYKDIAISGTSITTTLNRSVYITSDVADYSTATITQGSDNLVYIYKVIGYK